MSADQSQGALGVFGLTPSTEALVAPTLASLPETLHRSGDASGSIHVVDGRLPDWPRAVRVAAEAGAAAVYVLDPSVVRRAELDEIVGLATSMPIGLDLAWAGHPALQELHAVGDGSTRAVVVNGSVGWASSDDLMMATVDAVAAATRMMGRAPTLVRSTHDEWSASAAGRWGAVVLRLSVVRSAAVGRSFEIAAHADRQTWIAHLPDPATATPALVTLTDGDGSRLLPTVYESSRRASLRGLAECVRRGRARNDVANYRNALDALWPSAEPEGKR